jgi:hypothetical protein
MLVHYLTLGVSDSATIIRDGDDFHQLQIAYRDWMLISGPGFVEAKHPAEEIGVALPARAAEQSRGAWNYNRPKQR